MSFEDVIRQIIREENQAFLEEIKTLINATEKINVDDVITVEEACKILKMGKSSVYELANHQDFPAVRTGRKVRIIRKGLQEWIDRQKNNNQVI
ncbi:helix-turn-helix domain-containing protein [Bacillus gobiensis]|uniref:helix-turn-helix domain-containing protein n=1 Tax=Bacillus gobiensis TaxID=1441095 RepID=UPI003D1D6866